MVAAMDWTVSPQNSFAEALTSIVIVFEHRTFQEIVKVKYNHKSEALILLF